MNQQLEKINVSSEKIDQKPKSFKQQSIYQSSQISGIKNWNLNLTLTQIVIFALCIILFIEIFYSIMWEDKPKINQLSDAQQQIKNVQLNQEKKVSIIQQAQPKNKGIEVTVVIINSQRYELLIRCLQSFFTFNTYPIKNIIVVEDGVKNPELDKLMDKYKNIKWLVTGDKIGQLLTIDYACRNIETEFYFMLDGDYEFIRKGFIEQGLKIIKSDYTLSSVVLANWDGPQIEDCTILQNINCTFSFKPSFHRLSAYNKLPNTYSGLTKNYSYGLGGGDALLTIGYYYHLIGKHVYIHPEEFVIHIGADTDVAQKNGFSTDILLYEYQKLDNSQKAQYLVSYSWRELKQIREQLIKNIRIEFREGLYMDPLPKSSYAGQSLSQYGIDEEIQLHSQFDYMNLVKTKFYRDFIRKYSKLYSYESKLEIPSNINNQPIQNSPLLCIMISGTQQQFSSPNFQLLLKFIKDHSYAGVVSLAFVGSNSSIQSALAKIQALKIKEKIKQISYNKDINNYTSPGMFYFSKKFCRRNSVIVSLKPTDQLKINALRAIRSSFQDPNLMFATFRTDKIKTENLDQTILGQFRSKNQIDLAPFLKAYRHRLTIPSSIAYLTEFIYIKNTKSFFPRFYQTNSDDFQTYLLIEMAGQKGVRFFNQSLGVRYATPFTQKCQEEKQKYMNSKAKIKTPVKQINLLTEKIQTISGHVVPPLSMNNLKSKYKNYIKCLTQKDLDKK